MVCAVTAEYNPFHNGHQYQIDYIRNNLHADYIIAAMSGDYVQRGVPALLSKQDRTRMALVSGVDLILELPVSISCASAEGFAYGAVSLFHALGCVDSICFGVENDDLDALRLLADVLAEEPEEYRNLLKEHLQEGMSFPTARSQSLTEYLSGSRDGKAFCRLSSADRKHPSISERLNTPNNILAVEYLKALRLLDSPIRPEPLKRTGMGYHDSTLLSDRLPSATAIRAAFAESVSMNFTACMPQGAAAVMEECRNASRYVLPDDYSDLLFSQILRELEDGQHTDALSNRILRKHTQFRSFTQFASLLKTKEVTQTAIQRTLLQKVLGFQPVRRETCPYARILGFRSDSASLLGMIKNSSTIPLLSRMSDVPLSDDMGIHMLKETVFASNLYERMRSRRSDEEYRHEFEKQLVIV